MDYRSLVNKLEAIQAGTYISEATAPTQFKPTHFHKGNLGNENPVMQTPDGAWWHETSQSGEGGGGYAIVPWQGDTKNRSAWNPASIDGIYINGKPVAFPEGVTWDTYRPAEKPVEKPVDKPAEVPVAAEKKPVKFGDADRAAADMQKLDDLTKQLLASGAAKPVEKPADKPVTATPSAGGSTGWKQIYDMNKDVIGDNPNLIKPGQQLKMPDGSTYTVKPGDSLSKIAGGAKGTSKKGGGAMPAASDNTSSMPAVDIMGNVTGFNEGGGDDYKLTPMEAKAALIHGSEQDIEMLGGKEKLEQIASGLNESMSIKNSLLESFGYLEDDVNVGQAKNVRFKEPIPDPGKGAFSNMADQLTKSPSTASAVDKVAGQAGISAGEKAAGTAAAKAATSGAWDMLKKRLPFIGSAFGAYDTVNRFKKGDYPGAGIAAAATAANLLPGLGTAASIGLDGINIARDYQRGEFKESQSESIGNLRDRLKDIENTETVDESTAADIWKAGRELGGDAVKAIKNFGKGVKSPTVTPLPNVGQAKNVKFKGPSTAFKAGQATGRNPQVVAGTVAGAGGAAMLGGNKDAKAPADQVAQADGSNKGNKGQGGMPSAGGTSADQQAIIDQMNEIIARYNGEGADDEILSHIVPAQNAIAKVTGQGSQSEFTPPVKGQGAQPSSEEKRTPAQVQASADLNKAGLEESDELARWLKIARG